MPASKPADRSSSCAKVDRQHATPWPPDGVATLLLHPVNCPAASLCDACCSLPQLRDILLFHITSPAAIDRPVLLADLVRMRS